MRITETTAIALSYRVPDDASVRLGIGATTKRDAIVVRVRTDAGITGYGEAHPGRSPGAVVSLINSTLGPLIAGMDACDTVGVFARVNRMQLASHGLGAAACLGVSGIDLALWDIRGKAAGMPLYQLLGGSHRRIPAYAGGISLGFQPAASLVDEAREYVARGYRAVKLRVGDNPRDDIARVQAVRAALGDAVEIMVDANTGYTLADARRVIPAYAEARVSWLEEPFACNDWAAYRMGAAISPLLALAAGENHYTRYDFARMVEERAVQIVQPDLSKAGGLTEAMRIAAIASAWSLPVNPHSSATGLNHAASIHFLAALDNGGWFEACVARANPLRDLFGPAFEIGADGCVAPLQRPGIGLDVDESVFANYPPIDGPGYVVRF
jgi:L-alanine-DL-glutamate epimerase-like enolase superfamily enzyme